MSCRQKASPAVLPLAAHSIPQNGTLTVLMQVLVPRKRQYDLQLYDI